MAETQQRPHGQNEAFCCQKPTKTTTVTNQNFKTRRRAFKTTTPWTEPHAITLQLKIKRRRRTTLRILTYEQGGLQSRPPTRTSQQPIRSKSQQNWRLQEVRKQKFKNPKSLAFLFSQNWMFKQEKPQILTAKDRSKIVKTTKANILKPSSKPLLKIPKLQLKAR